MKHLKGNKNTFQKRMYCKKTEIDLSKSGTGLFPGDFYMNRHVKRVILPDYTVQGMYKPEGSYPPHRSGYR